jgi:hypothetical protein
MRNVLAATRNPTVILRQLRRPRQRAGCPTSRVLCEKWDSVR